MSTKKEIDSYFGSKKLLLSSPHWGWMPWFWLLWWCSTRKVSLSRNVIKLPWHSGETMLSIGVNSQATVHFWFVLSNSHLTNLFKIVFCIFFLLPWNHRRQASAITQQKPSALNENRGNSWLFTAFSNLHHSAILNDLDYLIKKSRTEENQCFGHASGRSGRETLQLPSTQWFSFIREDPQSGFRKLQSLSRLWVTG